MALAQAAELQQQVKQMQLLSHSTMQSRNAAAPEAVLTQQQKPQQQQGSCRPATTSGAGAAAGAGSKLHEDLAAGGPSQQEHQIPVVPQMKCSSFQQQRIPSAVIRSQAEQESRGQHGPDTAVVCCGHPVYEVMTDCTNTMHHICSSCLYQKQQQKAGSSDGSISLRSQRVGLGTANCTIDKPSSPVVVAAAGIPYQALETSSRQYAGQHEKDSARAVRAAADAAICGRIGRTHWRAAAVCSTAAPAL